MASQITGVSIVYTAVCTGGDQRKHQSSTSLTFVRWVHRWPVPSLHKGLTTRKMFPFDDVIVENISKCITWISWHANHNWNEISQKHLQLYCIKKQHGYPCLIKISAFGSPRKVSWSLILVYGVHKPWWRHQMETFSALLAICAGNSPVHGEFPPQRPVTRSFDVFFDLRLNKRLIKHSWGWWFETLSCALWRHCNATISTKMQSNNLFIKCQH